MRSLRTRTSDDARRQPPLHLETWRMALTLDSVRLIRDRCPGRGPLGTYERAMWGTKYLQYLRTGRACRRAKHPADHDVHGSRRR